MWRNKIMQIGDYVKLNKTWMAKYRPLARATSLERVFKIVGITKTKYVVTFIHTNGKLNTEYWEKEAIEFYKKGI